MINNPIIGKTKHEKVIHKNIFTYLRTVLGPAVGYSKLLTIGMFPIQSISVFKI